VTTDALVKHAVRHGSWLPACKRRRSSLPDSRPLSYFTFVGSQPLDVLLLAVEDVLPHTSDDGYSAVTFFDKNGDDPSLTAKMIPGARAFGGPFVRTVLADTATDAEEPGRHSEVGSSQREEYQLLLDTQTQFRGFFPFDVINFDLEAVPFRANERPPGALFKALSRLFEWQAQETNGHSIEAFSLMLTVPLSSADVDDTVRELLSAVVQKNLDRFPDLAVPLLKSRGLDSVEALLKSQWETLFAVAIPKVVFDALFESGWTFSTGATVDVVRRERNDGVGPAVFYHVLLEVERRPAGVDPRAATTYETAVSNLMTKGPARVSEGDVSQAVRTSYAKVVARAQAAGLGVL
jgi:hypothetical protein